MKSKIQVLKEIDKNLTYESIRFNNKQVSDENIKSAIQQYFPKLFEKEKWKEITFFIKAMKDEQFYKKIKSLIGLHLNLQNHLGDIEQKQIEKIKIQDLNEQISPNNKKMTRAALAKRNQQTQQQLRKDQIYVRLTPRTPNCMQWMLSNRNFPRIQCKLSCNQHLQYLINYLSNKWLRGKGHNLIIALYPDISSYLKNSISPKERQKLLKEPLNNYYMFTDIMIGSGIAQNGVLSLQYEILQKKKEVRPTQVPPPSTGLLKSDLAKDLENPKKNFDSQQKPLVEPLVEPPGSGNKKQNSGSKQVSEKYVPVNVVHNKRMEPILPVDTNNLNNMQKPKPQTVSLSYQGHSNNYLFPNNESNIMNPNKSPYHDEESIFKSIGFFGFGNQNSLGYSLLPKKTDYLNLMSANSNSYLDVGQGSPDGKAQGPDKSKQISKVEDQAKGKQKLGFIRTQKSVSLVLVEPRQRQSPSGRLDHEQSSLLNGGSNPLKKMDKLNDLRNAINFVQQNEGFGNGINEQEESQKSGLKQIKTVSIKKKAIN